MDAAEFGNGLTPADLADLRGLGRQREWLAGDVLFHEGDQSSTVVLLQRGRAKVYSLTENGDEIVLAVRGPGALLGELSAVDGAPRSASVSALEPVSALVLPVGDFVRFLESHPEGSMQMVRVIVARLRDADRKRVEFGAYDTLSRVASRLVELAERFGMAGERGIRITLPITQDELAGWVGSSREAVTKALRVLRDEKTIATHRKAVSVLDLPALRSRTGTT